LADFGLNCHIIGQKTNPSFFQRFLRNPPKKFSPLAFSLKLWYLIIGNEYFKVFPYFLLDRPFNEERIMSLTVCEVFRSIQGESSYAGFPCAFVRLSGCNLRCRYCDTPYAQLGKGEEMTVAEILDRINNYGFHLVEVTGGEPLVQDETPHLVQALLERGHTVLVETNGSLDISALPEGTIRIMDIKCPSSGESGSMLWNNIWKLRPVDEVKFVISDRHDYEWTLGIISERFGHTKTNILLSAVFGELPPGKLVEWMLADKVRARFQLQLHKYIWPHDARGV
jgi:7-carboxy-7-deazaguanine synthase